MQGRALSDWLWRGEAKVFESMVADRSRGITFINLEENNVVWPKPEPDWPDRPTPLINRGAWRYGQNATTIHIGWYPDMFVVPPDWQHLDEVMQRWVRRREEE